MTTVNIYLNFDGQCEDAFQFYKTVFGGDFSYIGRFKDMPSEHLSAADAERVMHVTLPISKETCLMGSDIASQYASSHKVGNNCSVSINVESQQEADRLFNGLSAGGTITMPMEKTFWGAYFGMFIDKFGINWMVNFDEQP